MPYVDAIEMKAIALQLQRAGEAIGIAIRNQQPTIHGTP
jgi:hypothetical protein